MSHGYFQHGGVTFPGLLYSPRGLEAARDFQVEDDDVFNVTYQKSGTVWMLEILSLIRSKGDPNWVRSVPNWDRGPWLETLLGYRRAKGNPRPRIISSHLPVHLFPTAFFGSKAKVIYTIRDPKDVLVSLFHFARIFRPYKDPGTLEEFMEKFLQGDVPFGSWFQHVRGWLQLRGKENFFWITYEELQQDLAGSVLRLCHFLGTALSPAALQAVVTNASFGAMRDNPMSNFSRSPRMVLDASRGSFLRKGISGDWRNHLSAEQSQRFDLIYRQSMEGLGVSFPWDPPGEPQEPPNPPQKSPPGSPQEPPNPPQKSPQKPPNPPQKSPPGSPQEPPNPPQKSPPGSPPESPQKPPNPPQKSPPGSPPESPQKPPNPPQKSPQKPPNPPQKSPQKPPNPPQKSPQKPPNPPQKSPPGSPKSTPKSTSKSPPKSPKSIPKSAPKSPQSSPKSPQKSPKSCQEQEIPEEEEKSQKMAQETSKTSQDSPKNA